MDISAVCTAIRDAKVTYEDEATQAHAKYNSYGESLPLTIEMWVLARVWGIAKKGQASAECGWLGVPKIQYRAK